MKTQQKLQLASLVLFFLMLIGYRYSLLHDVSQLSYLNTPETVAPFTKIATYFFMFIGILPTILLIVFTAFLCQTSYPAGVVLYTCFGSPFALADSSGFSAYIIASVISAVGIYFIISTIFDAQKSRV